MDITQIGQLVGVILVVCWVAKKAGLNSKFIPILALVLGGAGAVYFSSGDFLTSLNGILIGLMTTLGYREVKSSLE